MEDRELAALVLAAGWPLPEEVLAARQRVEELERGRAALESKVGVERAFGTEQNRRAEAAKAKLAEAEAALAEKQETLYYMGDKLGDAEAEVKRLKEALGDDVCAILSRAQDAALRATDAEARLARMAEATRELLDQRRDAERGRDRSDPRRQGRSRRCPAEGGEPMNDQGLAADWPRCICGHTKRRHLRIAETFIDESCCKALDCFCPTYHPNEDSWRESEVQPKEEARDA